mgnify:FL=1|jgi:hypothetical protein
MPTWTEEEMETKEETTTDIKKITEAGRYAVEVTYAVDKGLNRNGHAYWSIGFSTVDDSSFVCYDNLTIEGDMPHIAFKKMTMLGIEQDDDGNYNVGLVDELKGKRCFVTVKKDEYNGKKKLKTYPCKGTFFGYEPFTTTAPAEVAEDEVEDIDVPF